MKNYWKTTMWIIEKIVPRFYQGDGEIILIFLQCFSVNDHDKSKRSLKIRWQFRTTPSLLQFLSQSWTWSWTVLSINFYPSQLSISYPMFYPHKQMLVIHSYAFHRPRVRTCILSIQEVTSCGFQYFHSLCNNPIQYTKKKKYISLYYRHHHFITKNNW